LADYYDMLARNAFGRFPAADAGRHAAPRDGRVPQHARQPEARRGNNIRPDENYARELLQLFTVGLVELNSDGTSAQGADGVPLPTYDQSVIEGFANVSPAELRGLGYVRTGPAHAREPDRADAGIPGAALAARKEAAAYSAPPRRTCRPASRRSRTRRRARQHFQSPERRAVHLEAADPEAGDQQPVARYVARVTAKFNNDGTGKARQPGGGGEGHLLDAEARPATAAAATGKVKEPLIRLTSVGARMVRRAANGQYRIGNINAVFGQGPLQSPSVFNFFSPFYARRRDRRPGPRGAELQIATEYLNTTVTNTFYNVHLFLELDGAGCRPTPSSWNLAGGGAGRRLGRRW